MKLFKKVLAGVAMAAAVASAQASPITVGGITWDPDSVIDFKAEFSFAQFFDFSGAAPQLKGFGEVFKVNGVSADQASTSGGGALTFAPGRELTFDLGGFLAVGTGLNTFSGGFLNLYSDSNNDYNVDLSPLNMSAATNTDLSGAWLKLEATSSQFVSNFPNGDNPLSSGQLTVQWNVVGGLAASNFDTNFYVDYDVRSRASAEFTDNLATGNGTITSNSIPEPTSLALLGLGLLGVAAARRKSAK